MEDPSGRLFAIYMVMALLTFIGFVIALLHNKERNIHRYIDVGWFGLVWPGVFLFFIGWLINRLVRAIVNRIVSCWTSKKFRTWRELKADALAKKKIVPEWFVNWVRPKRETPWKLSSKKKQH